MPSLATLADVRSEGNFPSSDTISDAKLQPSLNFAVIEMGRLLTSAVYSAIVGEAGTVQRKIDCTKAEALLAVAYVVHVLNIQTSGTGIMQSVGWDQSRSDLMSRRDVEDLSGHFRALAMKMLAPYIPTPALPEGDNGQTITAGSLLFASV